ncbi:MAG: alpha/beta hydrolase [Chloroflexota bacterium]
MSFTTSVKQYRHQFGQVSITYEVAGDGPPIVLIHGIAGSSRWWSHNVKSLAQYFRVYVIDLVGFGASQNTHPFVLEEAATLLVQWMDHLEIDQAAFIGHSMGGFVVAELAADCPDRVSQLVLVDAAAIPFDIHVGQQSSNILHAMKYIPWRFLPVLLADTYRAGPATLFKASYELLKADIRSKLVTIHTPTLVVWGEYDWLVPLQVGKQLCRYIPGTQQLVTIKKAGHNPMWDRPAAFNQTIIDFLQSTRDAEAPNSSPDW